MPSGPSSTPEILTPHPRTVSIAWRMATFPGYEGFTGTRRALTLRDSCGLSTVDVACRPIFCPSPSGCPGRDRKAMTHVARCVNIMLSKWFNVDIPASMPDAATKTMKPLPPLPLADAREIIREHAPFLARAYDEAPATIDARIQLLRRLMFDPSIVESIVAKALSCSIQDVRGIDRLLRFSVLVLVCISTLESYGAHCLSDVALEEICNASRRLGGVSRPDPTTAVGWILSQMRYGLATRGRST